MNYTLINTAAALVVITLSGWLLHVGSSFLLPFVVAVIIWYIIATLAGLVQSFKVGGVGCPKWLATIMALATIAISLNLFTNMLTGTLVEFANDAPIYQERLDTIIASIQERFDLDDNFHINEILPSDLLSQVASGLTAAFATILGQASLIFVYVVFILLEQSTFDGKFNKSVAHGNKFDMALSMRSKITSKITHYFGIKTCVSIITGTITGLFLHFIGMPYAVLFGTIACLLNFIPTFGSLISVVLPSLLALFLYDQWTTFAIVAIALGCVQFGIGSLLEPRLLGTGLRISPLVIVVMLSFWGAIWGVVGMILCVPLTVIIMVICAQFPRTRPIAVLLSNDGNIGDHEK